MTRIVRLVLACAALLAQAACDTVSTGVSGPTLSVARLAGGAVTVAGPEGYCIDRDTMRSTADGGFALLAPCLGTEAGDPALATVSVGPAGAADLPGAAELAQGSDAVLLSEAAQDGLVLVHLQGGSAPLVAGRDARHWRAAFLLGDRLVALAVYAPEGSALAGGEGASMLAALRDALVAHNAAARTTG